MKICLYIFLLTSFILSQQLNFIKSIGNFENATNICLIDNDNIYVIDRMNNRLVQLNSFGEILNETGGYGWCNTCFDFPSDIYTNILNIFVVDKNNNSFTIFDKKLNFLSKTDLTKKNIGIQKAKFFQISQDGFIFIYDEIKKRIFKLTMNLTYQIDFGGINYANYYIGDINKLVVDNYVCAVKDTSIYFFDKFGLPYTQFFFTKKIKSFKIINNIYYILFDNFLTIGNLKDGTSIDLDISNFNNFVDLEVFEKKIYILTKKEILIFELIQ